MSKNLWTREELILAFNLYLKIEFGKTHKGNPEVIAQFKKPNAQTHIRFLPANEPRLKKPKELFFANASQKYRKNKVYSK